MTNAKCPDCGNGTDVELIDTIWEEPERELWIAVCQGCGKEFEWLKENDEGVKLKFNVGDRVRILEHAFPNSDEICDIESRGTIGVIIDWDNCLVTDSPLYIWRGDNGHETCPIETELELVKGD